MVRDHLLVDQGDNGQEQLQPKHYVVVEVGQSKPQLHRTEQRGYRWGVAVSLSIHEPNYVDGSMLSIGSQTGRLACELQHVHKRLADFPTEYLPIINIDSLDVANNFEQLVKAKTKRCSSGARVIPDQTISENECVGGK